MGAELVAALYEDKIKQLLDKLLQPDFEIKTDTYLNILLSHLSGKEDKDLGETLINLPIFTEWLSNCISLWENGNPLPSANIIAFVLQIASVLSKNETRFTSFKSSNLYARLFTTLKIKDTNFGPLVQLAYIKLLSSFLQHKSGINWLIAGNDWMDILRFCLMGQTIYIVREGHNFMYGLLVGACGYNEQFCNTVVKQITLVINQTQLSDTAILEINGDAFPKKLTPSLRLIGHILESYLRSDFFVKLEYNVPGMFLRNLDLEQNMWKTILTGIKNRDLIYDLSKVIVLNNFFKIAIECESTLYEHKENQKMITSVLILLKQLVLKYDVLNILKLGHCFQYYWNIITPRLGNVLKNRDTLPIVFDYQVIIFQIFPILVISHKYCDFNMEEATKTGSWRDELITKIQRNMSQDTIRWMYHFRVSLEADTLNIFQNAQKSIMYIMKSRPYFQREIAIVTLQFFIYTLKDVARVMIEKPETIEIFMKNSGYFLSHLDAIAVFLQEYDITWRESVETICIMSTAIKFVNISHWPSRLVVQVLKLVNLCIARFTTPNLALLIDRTSDSSMHHLGPLLKAKLHDTNWEVRDSSLEVLHTVCSIAHTKFPSFQVLLLEYELPQLIVTMCIHDSESYVRASALKCLKEMIQVAEIWESFLKLQQLPEKMMQVLYNETEAIARCQAVLVLCEIYQHHLFDQSLIESVNQAMVYAAISDLHWEVKLNALCYWNSVVSNRLSHEGMIDGAFPDVTFSTEHKKIVTLTDMEIKNRLKKVFKQLSECGCLGVLVSAMQDESDLEVSKKAVEITKILSKLVEKYNLIYDNTDTPSASSVNIVPKEPLLTASPTGVGLSEDIINEIINTTDYLLLPHMYVNNGDEVSVTKTFPDTKLIITPENFVTFIKKDLDLSIIQRQSWLNRIDDLGSLLDDMLRNYDRNDETNTMDCY